jgi:hypothetical protein
LPAIEEATAQSTSKQDDTWVNYDRALIALAEGALDDAVRLSRHARDAYFGGDAPLAGVLTTHIDALLRDASALSADIERLHAFAPYGAVVRRGIRTAEAAHLALNGRPEEARAAYRLVLAEWRAGENKWDLALALLAQAQVMGATDPEAQSARHAARELFTEMGIVPAFERITAALRPAAEPATRSSSLSEGAAVARR